MVAVAVAGGVTAAGLTEQTGVEVVGCVEVIWHPRVTVPLKLFTGSTRIDVAEVPPGTMATGSSVVVLRVNSLVPCARAAGAKTGETTSTNSRAKPLIPVQSFTLGANPFNFTMSRLISFDSQDRKKAARRRITIDTQVPNQAKESPILPSAPACVGADAVVRLERSDVSSKVRRTREWNVLSGEKCFGKGTASAVPTRAYEDRGFSPWPSRCCYYT